MRYWEYLPDGSLFAPRAGENHAFRELISKQFPGYTDTPPATTPGVPSSKTDVEPAFKFSAPSVSVPGLCPAERVPPD